MNHKYSKQTSWSRHRITQFLSCVTVLPAQRTVLRNILSFMLLASVHNTAHQTMHSARHCFQISRFSIHCVFPCLIHSIPSNWCLSPTARKLKTLKVASLIQFGRLSVYGGRWYAQQWRHVVLPRGLRRTQNPLWKLITSYGLAKQMT